MTSRNNKRTRVFLTGTAGSWGRKVLDELRTRSDRIEVIALVLPTPKDLEVIRRYEDMENLEVICGQH